MLRKTSLPNTAVAQWGESLAGMKLWRLFGHVVTKSLLASRRLLTSSSEIVCNGPEPSLALATQTCSDGDGVLGKMRERGLIAGTALLLMCGACF